MKAQIGRELDRLELLLDQIAAVEAERDAMLARQPEAGTAQSAQGAPAPVQKPMDLNGPGAETVAEAEAAPGVQSAQNSDQEKPKAKKRGFFSRLFGGKKDDQQQQEQQQQDQQPQSPQ